MAAIWPSAVAGDSNLYIAVNSLQSSLTTSLTSGVTTIPVASTSGFPTVGFLTIDNEVVLYSGISGNSFTGCTRGADGTTAAAHANGTATSHAIVAAHHNALKDEVKAIEQWLANNIGTGALPLTASKIVATDGSNKLTTLADPLPVAHGGTNSAASLNNNRVMVSSGSAVVEAAGITASRALASDANGIPVAATTTAAELNFVSGVTSAVQTQLGTKAPLASPTFTGTIGTPLTGSKIVQTDVSGNLTTSTEVGTGSVVRATSPTLVTPILGVATTTSMVSTTGTTASINGSGTNSAALFVTTNNQAYIIHVHGNSDAGYYGIFLVADSASGINSTRLIGHTTLSITQASANHAQLTGTSTGTTQTYSYSVLCISND